MAEIAGLALGTVALASLFSTCVDLIEALALEQNHVFDYHLACTKIGLLLERLRRWGHLLDLDKPSSQAETLQRRWMTERNSVARGLLGIQCLLNDTARLTNKHQIASRPKPNREWIRAHSTDTDHVVGSADQDGERRARGWSALRKRTAWAIHDKAKLDSFVADLAFLIDNLEKVADRIGRSGPAEERLTIEQSDRKGSAMNEHHKSQLTTSYSISNRFDKADTDSESDSSLRRPPKQSSEISEISGKQINHGSAFGVIGTIGQVQSCFHIQGKQENLQNSFGVIGMISEGAARSLRR